jgi:hypothetical protein
LKELDEKAWTGLNFFTLRAGENWCEHCNEPSGCIKWLTFGEQVRKH